MARQKIANADEARDFLRARSGGYLVQSNCGYPYLITDDADGDVILKSPGDDRLIDDEDECCWPWTVIWSNPEDGLDD